MFVTYSRLTLLALASFALPFAAHAADPATTSTDPEVTKAAAYCASTGGTIFLRRATYGTNDPASDLKLSAVKPFCQYTASDGSTIHVLASTLYTTEPTLAALAYYSQTPSGSCQGSPGSCYCTLLGGTDLFGGINAAGGGWVNNASVIGTLDACIFPDLSSIDSYGLFYHSAGIVRGIDLNGILRYANPNPTVKK